MKDFEHLYSKFEDTQKNDLLVLKRKAKLIGYFSILITLVILMSLSVFLFNKHGDIVLPAIMICAVMSIPIHLILKSLINHFIKKRKPHYQSYEELYLAFYFNNIVKPFIKEKYGFNISHDGYFDKSLLSISNIELHSDFITSDYELNGFCSSSNEQNAIDISVLTTRKYTGPNTDTDAGTQDFKHVIFAAIGCNEFNDLTLEITNNQMGLFNSRSKFEIKNPDNIFLSYKIDDYLQKLQRRISITIRDSYFYLCLHMCRDMRFNGYDGKKSLRNLCNNIDLIEEIFNLLKDNIKI